jgi:hypothetical protein
MLSYYVEWHSITDGKVHDVNSRTKLCVTRGSRQAAEVLKILRLSELDPPEAPEGKETTV